MADPTDIPEPPEETAGTTAATEEEPKKAPAKKAAVKKPAAKKPAAKKPAAKKPAAKKPAAKKPAAKKPAAKKPAAKKPAAKKPAVKKPEPAPKEEAPASPPVQEQPKPAEAAEAPSSKPTPRVDVKESATTDPQADTPTPPAEAKKAAGPTPVQPAAYTRDNESGLDAISIVPVILVVLTFMFVFYSQCVGDNVATDAGDTPAEGVVEAPATNEVPGDKAPALEAPSSAEEAAPATTSDKALAAAEAEAAAKAAVPPVTVEPGSPAETYAASARTKLSASDTTGAMADVNLAMAEAPGNPVYERLQAQIYMTQGNQQAALTALNQAVKHDGRNPDVYRERAAVLLAGGDNVGAGRNMQAADRLANGTSPTSPP